MSVNDNIKYFIIRNSSGGIGKLVDITIGLRVTPAEETVGLDISQHGERAYGGFLR
jgi:ammonia channel protein AmtB